MLKEDKFVNFHGLLGFLGISEEEFNLGNSSKMSCPKSDLLDILGLPSSLSDDILFVFASPDLGVDVVRVLVGKARSGFDS